MLWPSITLRTASSSAPEESARSLEQRIARGDHDAIAEAYRLHHAHVRAFAQRLVGERALAEDLVHEVFVGLPEAMKRFRGECTLKSWLIAIASRRAHTHVRAARRRRAAESRLGLEPRGAPLRPDACFDRAELATMLTTALDALPLEQRVAFVLCEVEERTSVEVAAMLGETDGTIRARVFHAKKKLRGELARLGGEEQGP